MAEKKQKKSVIGRLLRWVWWEFKEQYINPPIKFIERRRRMKRIKQDLKEISQMSYLGVTRKYVTLEDLSSELSESCARFNKEKKDIAEKNEALETRAAVCRVAKQVVSLGLWRGEERSRD